MACSRFPTLNEEEISTLLSEKDSKSTKRATKRFKSIFEEYIHEKKQEYPTNAIELAAILKLFYAEARKQNGELNIYFEYIIKQLLDSVFA